MKWNVNFRLPNKLEVGLLFLGWIIWTIVDYAQNHAQDVNDISVLSIFHVNAFALFWIGILAYHLILYIVIVRSIVKKKSTSVAWDFIFGSLAILGTYFMITGAVAGIYYGATEAVPWFYNIAQITMYHVFGVAIQVIAYIWYMVTD